MKLIFDRKKQIALLFSLLSFSVSGIAGPFSVGSKSLSVNVGSGRAFNDNYTIIGAGIGYYVVEGLQLSIDAEFWTGGERSIRKLSPGMQYVFTQSQEFKPYVGVIFKRAYIDGFENFDSIGTRVGAVISSQSNYYMSAGLVYEKDLNCNETTIVQCDDTYPELSLTFLL